MNTATNFGVTAVLGALIFGEELPGKRTHCCGWIASSQMPHRLCEIKSLPFTGLHADKGSGGLVRRCWWPAVSSSEPEMNQPGTPIRSQSTDTHLTKMELPPTLRRLPGRADQRPPEIEKFDLKNEEQMRSKQHTTFRGLATTWNTSRIRSALYRASDRQMASGNSSQENARTDGDSYTADPIVQVERTQTSTLDLCSSRTPEKL